MKALRVGPKNRTPFTGRTTQPAAEYLAAAVALSFTSLVLIEAETDAVRTNYSNRLLFGRGTVAAAAPGAPWYLWAPTIRQTEPEEDARRADHSALHRYRTGYQTVGQPYITWSKPQQRTEDAEQEIRQPASLFPFRQPAAVASTAGAPWYLWETQSTWVGAEEDLPSQTSHARLHLYRTGFQTVGQPQFLLSWKTSQPELPEAYEVRAAPPDLHRYRQAYQTVGQGYRLWPKQQARFDEEDHQRTKPADLSPYRQPAAVATVGAPWYLWAPPIQRIEPEEDARRADHTALHRYRVGYQTVGQSWQYWIKPQQRVDEDAYAIPGPPSLLPYRQVTQIVSRQPWYLWKPAVADQSVEQDAQRTERSLHPFRATQQIAQAGQPWWMWPRAVADQTVEPNPVVTNHAAVMYPFRPHDAITPTQPVIDDDDEMRVAGGPRRPDYRVRNMEAIIATIVAAIDAADG